MEKFFTTELKCLFCKAKQGEHIASSRFWDHAPTLQELGFVDTRCESCASVYGDFKALAQEFIDKTKKTWPEAEVFVVANPKRADFDREITKHLPVKKEKNDSEVVV